MLARLACGLGGIREWPALELRAREIFEQWKRKDWRGKQGGNEEGKQVDEAQ